MVSGGVVDRCQLEAEYYTLTIDKFTSPGSYAIISSSSVSFIF